MKYFFILLCIVNQAQACWFFSKQQTLGKIKTLLENAHAPAITKDLVKNMAKTLPAPVSWAINTIGIDTAFKDCDMNTDGILTLQEINDSVTCLTSCAKLAIVNSAL